MTERTPWPLWIAGAAAEFGVAPEAFWRLSLREWRALNAAPAVHPMTKHEFAALASRYPDFIHG
jgi:hypothetical protein